MQENPVQVILTIKKPPRHANTQMYTKPIRLPSKKRTYSPWDSYVGASSNYDLKIPNLPLPLYVFAVSWGILISYDSSVIFFSLVFHSSFMQCYPLRFQLSCGIL